MKTNFKKITAVAASFLVAGLTLGTASAAQYPAPFKDNGSIDAAIVYGSDAASTDQTAASNIQEDLDLPSTTSVSVGGSSVDLHRDNSRLYLGDELNEEQSSALDDGDMPEILSEETFDGADASGSTGVDYDQEVTIGSDSNLVYEQQPSDDEDPVVGWNMTEDSDNSSKSVFEYTLDFDDSVDFTDEESIGEVIEMQGEEYAVSGETSDDGSDLYLTESAEELDLEYGPEASGVREQSVTIDGQSYTIRLESASDGSDSSARVTVTGPDGSSDSESIDEDTSREVHDLTVTPTYTNSDDVGDIVSATIVVSGEEGQIRLANNNSVEVGTDESTVDGTWVQVNGGSGNFTSTDTISVYSSGVDDDEDAITMDHAFTDPAFGNLNVVLEEFSSGTGMEDEGREVISVQNSDDETATIDFTSHEDNGQSMEWYEDNQYDTNNAQNGTLMNDDEKIHVVENETVYTDEYVVLSNEETGSGAILELTDVSEDDSDPSSDEVSFRNVLTGNEFDADIDNGNTNTAQIDELVDTYDFTYNETGEGYVNIDFDTANSGDKVVFPSIETSEGARLAFTEPVNVTVGSGDLLFPDGDEGYIDVNLPSSGTSENRTIRGWNYSITNQSSNQVYNVKLSSTESGTLNDAAVHLIEEENDDDEYGSVIVEMGTSDDEVEVADTHLTSDLYKSENINHESNDDMTSMMDFWGTKVMTDSSGDQDSVEISYPDSQLYADTVLTSSAETEESSGNVMYTDSETSSYEDRNIIVVGGSAVNEAAAQLMGVEYPTGGSDFTDAAGISQGEFLVRGYESPWNEDKVALLVAGYSASDTQDAANWVTSNDFDSSNVDYTGPTSGQ